MPEDDLDTPIIQDSHIRQVNVLHDLDPIADLVESCFSATLDEDGRAYIRQLRRSAEDARRLTWATRYLDDYTPPVKGFLWEEEGKLIGNLTLIPLRKEGQSLNLIANVAVLPAYRRRGIAEQLTMTALRYTRQNGNLPVWLQVRDDNQAAEMLYRKLGFVEQTRRTTWHFSADHADPAPSTLPEDFTIRPSSWRDWREQHSLLLVQNPPEYLWNLQVDFNSFKPGFLSHIIGYMPGDTSRTWSLYRGNTLIGVLCWEAARVWAENLWLGCALDQVDLTMRLLLPHAINTLQRHRPLSLNLSSAAGPAVLSQLGFENHYTLIWMENPPRD